MKEKFKDFFNILLGFFIMGYVVVVLWSSIIYIKTEGIWTGFSLKSVFLSVFLIAAMLVLPIFIGAIVTALVSNYLGERPAKYVGFLVMFIYTYTVIAVGIERKTGLDISEFLAEFFTKLWTTNII